ncbi:MAG: deoxyhypusine synthase family protein [Sphingomonas sp.]
MPIFCPAFVDSSAGFGLVKHQVDRAKEGKPYMVLDAIADFRELTDIKIKAGTTGLLMIGGGVPKNFIQDTVVCAEILGHDDVQVHKYAVQITVADVRDGAAPPRRSRRPRVGARSNTGIEQMVFAEAGSVMPLLASDAYHRGHWKTRAKRKWASIFA